LYENAAKFVLSISTLKENEKEEIETPEAGGAAGSKLAVPDFVNDTSETVPVSNSNDADALCEVDSLPPQEIRDESSKNKQHKRMNILHLITNTEKRNHES